MFLPAAGIYLYDSDLGDKLYNKTEGHYWSSTADGDNTAKSYGLDFSSGNQYVLSSDRNCGYSVRAVLNESAE